MMRNSPHEPQGRARLCRADFTAGGDASTAIVSAAWFAEYAHCVRLAALESRLDGVSPYREFMAPVRDFRIVEAFHEPGRHTPAKGVRILIGGPNWVFLTVCTEKRERWLAQPSVQRTVSSSVA